MKRFLLLIACLGILASSQAQLKKVRYQKRMDLLDQFEYNTNENIPLKKSIMSTGVKKLGTSANIYGSLLSSNHQVIYNPDLKSVVFIHRDASAKSGDGIEFDASYDNGKTWEKNVYGLTPDKNQFACRYPNITIYNPQGNTDIENAYVVGVGPAHLDGVWGTIWQSSATLTGRYVSDEYKQPHGDDFHPYGICSLPDGTLFSISTNVNDLPSGASDPLNSYSMFYINKGVFNEELKKVIWTPVEMLIPDFEVFEDSEGDEFHLTNDWDIAFSPDGKVGYAVIVTKEKDKGSEPLPAPLVWKSTDSGETWTKLENYDFTKLASLKPYITRSEGVIPRPYITEVDAVVDKNNKLHLFSEIYSGSGEVGYIWEGDSTKVFVDLVTDDAIRWEPVFVEFKKNSYFEFGTGDESISIDAMPQIARSADGQYVFFTWNEEQGNSTTEEPDVLAKAMNVDAMVPTEYSIFPKTSAKVLSVDTDAEGNAYLHHISPVVISGGSEYDFEIPIVYAELGDTPDDEANYYYLEGVGFDISEIPAPEFIFETQPKVAVFAETEYSYEAKISDVTKGLVDVTILQQPDWLTIDFDAETNKVIFSGTPTADEVGEHEVSVNAYNQDVAIEHTYTLTVFEAEASVPPQFETVAPELVYKGDEYSYTVVVTDLNGDDLSITADELPSWMSFTDNGDGTATLSGIPEFEEIGDYTVSITVSDGENSVNQEFSLVVELFAATETQAKPEIQVYPNPVSSQLHISHVMGANIQIYSLLGTKVYEENSTSIIRTIDVSNFDAGNYIVRIVNNNEVDVMKICVVK